MTADPNFHNFIDNFLALFQIQVQVIIVMKANNNFSRHIL